MYFHKSSLLPLIFLLAGLTSVQPYINTQMFHNHQELEQEIDKLISDNRFAKYSCNEDPQIKKIRIEEAGAVISVVIFFSSEVCLQFMKRIKSKQIHSSANYTIFYESNLQREKAFQQDYCLRTNKNGVDLNRNFPTGFSRNEDEEQLNSGEEPLSENFTRCLESTVDKFLPNVFLDVHTGEFSIYYSQKNQTQMEVLSQVKEVCPNCRMRSEPKSMGMAFMDMKKRKKVEWSILFQIFGGFNYSLSRKDQCFVIFNPTSRKSYDFYLQRGVQMIQKFIKGVTLYSHKDQ